MSRLFALAVALCQFASGACFAAPPVSLRLDVLPALTKQACNSGACHGSPTGKGGFRLSLRGFDPELDQATLIREAFGRRANPAQPDQSLLLLKPTMQVAHGGGRKLRTSEPAYRVLRDWIAQGCRPDAEGTPTVTKLEISVVPDSSSPLGLPQGLDGFRATPNVAATSSSDEAVEPLGQAQGRFVARITSARPTVKLRVSTRATLSDGSVRDVTELTDFSSTDEQIAMIAADGLVTGKDRGETVVLARFLDQIAVVSLTFLRDVPRFRWSAPVENNVIDTLVFSKLKRLQIGPSELSSDGEFIRRATLDVTGQLPTPAETRAFLADSSASKRQQRIDELLEREAYSEFWALKVADLLQVKASKLSSAGVPKFHQWLVAGVRDNKPFDQFAVELLTARGSSYENPPAAFYRTSTDPNACSEIAAQLFLGIRIQCAKCHNHPYERWTQDNYYGLGAFFSRVRSQPSESGEDVVVWLAGSGEVTQPRTAQTIAPLLPGAGFANIAPQADRRAAFASWLVRSDNPFFAKVAVNRMWGHVMGRGLVEPVDDFRESNPASHPELLSALAAEFVKSGFNQKQMLRTILSSRVYQLSSASHEFNVRDSKYGSHALARPLSAEQLLDALCQVTDVPEKYVGLPAGTRATQLPSPDVGNDFLKVFGQPARNGVCECERADEPKLSQALQLINGELITRKLRSPGSRLSRLSDDTSARVKAAGVPTTDGLQVWLRADAAVFDARQSAAADGDAVGSWQDQSTAARHVAQTDAARQPRFVTRGIAGLPSLRFSGSSWLSNVADSAIAEGGPRTVIVLAQTGATDGGGSLVTFRRSTGGRAVFAAQHVLHQGTYYVYSDGANAAGNSAAAASTVEVIRKPFMTSFVSAGSGQKLEVQLNGRKLDITQPGAIGTDNGTIGFSVGNREDYPGFGWQGDLSEVLIYNKVLSAAEFAAVGAYLTTKYALDTSYEQRPIPRSTELAQRDREVVDDLYLAALSRVPTAAEVASALNYIAQSETRQQGIEDLFWAVLNSKEFLFQH